MKVTHWVLLITRLLFNFPSSYNPKSLEFGGQKVDSRHLPLLDHRRITKKERSVGSAFLHAECLRGW